MKIPKKYQDRVESYWKDEDGYWIILKEDWIAQYDEARTIHEDKWTYVLYELRLSKHL